MRLGGHLAAYVALTCTNLPGGRMPLQLIQE